MWSSWIGPHSMPLWFVGCPGFPCFSDIAKLSPNPASVELDVVSLNFILQRHPPTWKSKKLFFKMTNLTATHPRSFHRKTTSEEDNLKGRRPRRKMTSQEVDLIWRQYQRKTTLEEDDLTGRQPYRKWTSTEDKVKYFTLWYFNPVSQSGSELGLAQP